MIKIKRLSIMLAGCILASSVSAQSWQDRDWNRDRGGWQDRDRDWDRDRSGRERGRDWDQDRRWSRRDRGLDCYYVRRPSRDRFGDVVMRRYRVCED
jgi:hypothetical protein